MAGAAERPFGVGIKNNMTNSTSLGNGDGEKKKSRLSIYIFGAIVVAILAALVVPEYAAHFELGGEIFLQLLKMIVVPLVVTSVMSGILGLGDVRKLGKPGGCAVLYYLSTTILAVVVGLLLMNLIRPGVGYQEQGDLMEEAAQKGGKKDAAREKIVKSLEEDTGLEEGEIAEIFPQLKGESKEVSSILKNLVLMLFTDNLFSAAAQTELLPLIVFSIIFAGMLTTMGSRVGQLTTMINQVNNALLTFIMLLMQIAPIGIFCLVAGRFGEAQMKGEFVAELQKVGGYFVTVVGGLGIHALATLPLIYWLLTKRNPFLFLRHMLQAILTAFSTASSSATLPVTMECANKNAGVSKRSTEFVLPLGATINMDGTALYEAAAAIFIAQAIGMDLTLTQQLIIAVTATLAAIGAAGIPEAGLVTMIIVLNAVGLPVEYIGLILSVDWLLDRFRTAVNVFGDSVGAAVVDRVMTPGSAQSKG